MILKRCLTMNVVKLIGYLLTGFIITKISLVSAVGGRNKDGHKDTTKISSITDSAKQTKVLGNKVCLDNPCLNGGTCVVDHNFVDGFVCKCSSNYKGVRCKQLFCKVCLLKDAPFQCRLKRSIDHNKRAKTFLLVTRNNFLRSSRSVVLDIPQMVVHSNKAFIKEASTNPFTIEWYMKMQDTVNSNSDAQSHFTLIDKKFHDQPTLKDFSTIFEYFYRLHRTKSAMSVLRETPSVEANFFKDRDFVDQRFAGANVWQVYRVTNLQDDNGLDWQSFQAKLNRHFDWNNAVNQLLGTEDDWALDRAIEEKKLFIAWYPELEGVNLNKVQLVDHHFPNQTALKFTAPITMFLMKEEGPSEHLETVAIQADAIPEARVFTPADGKEWFFAKSLVQRADFNILQVMATY